MKLTLGLDDFVTAELDAVHERVQLLACSLDNLLALGSLREQGDDRDTAAKQISSARLSSLAANDSRVATDDGHDSLGGVSSCKTRKERGSPDDIERGDAEQPGGNCHVSAIEQTSNSFVLSRVSLPHKTNNYAHPGLGTHERRTASTAAKRGRRRSAPTLKVESLRKPIEGASNKS